MSECVIKMCVSLSLSLFTLNTYQMANLILWIKEMKQMRALKYIRTNKNGKQTSKTYFTVKDLFIWNGWHEE